jgi:hypothetical protein
MPFTATADGVYVHIKVTPKAAKNRVGPTMQDGTGQSILKIYVTEPPEDGKANESVIKLLAKLWKLPKTSIKVARGHTDKRKVLHIAGDCETLMKILRTCV